MNMQPVQSSNIRAIGYDPSTRDMEVHFRSGARYRYHGVDADAHEAFLNSPEEGSHGKHFHRYVRAGYEFERLS